MTPADLRAEALEHLRLAQEKLALADRIEAQPGAAPMAAPEKPDRWLDTNQARKISGVESSTLYRWARRFGIGEKTATRQWRFSERALRQVISSENHARGENGENGDGPGLPLANECAQF
jgi:hypothetical protein